MGREGTDLVDGNELAFDHVFVCTMNDHVVAIISRSVQGAHPSLHVLVESLNPASCGRQASNTGLSLRRSAGLV